jgi:uncharacterized membrane protein
VLAGILLVLLISIGIAPPDAAADLGGFHITRFNVEVQVQSNADLIIVERIEIRFTESRRGIYREIPVRYTDPTGFQYGYGFKLLGVEDEHGNSRQVKQSHEGSLIRLRIGNPDRTVNGTQVYIVRYRARDVLRHFAEHDELYWNVTGHQWNTTIGEASIVVRLPGEIPAESLEVAAWAGSYGNSDDNTRHSVTQPGEVSISSTVPLDRRQGLTVTVAWPPGAVKFPGLATRIWRFVSWNAIVLVPVLALVFLIQRFRKHGLDPGIPATVMVRYEPPPDISAGVIGTLVDERVDMADITATIVDLAVRGYLTIRTEVEEQFWGLKKTNTTSFTRRPDARTQELLPHERLFLDGLFASDADSVTTEDLKEEFYKKIPGIRSAMYDRLVEKRFASGNPQSVRRKTVGLGVFAGLLTGIGGMLLGTAQGAVFPNAAVLPVISALVTILLFAAFAPAMPRRTRAGVRAVSWARGFEEFAGRVEEDRFERDAARDMFESLLPYAMALGVATKWSRKFEGIYDDKQPDWYIGPTRNVHAFSTVSFHNSLQSAMSDTTQSLVATPRSSGSSGGGGFSGGGGGGGGGGSW